MKIRNQEHFDVWLFVKSINERQVTLTDEQISEELNVKPHVIAHWLQNLKEEGKITILGEGSERIIRTFTWAN